MDDQGKDRPDPKRLPRRNRPQQLQTHNVPTDDVENTNGTNYEGDLQFANKLRTVPRRIGRMPQKQQENYSTMINTSLMRAKRDSKM